MALLIRWKQDLTRETAAQAYRTLRRELLRTAGSEVRLELSDTLRLDSAGVGLLEELSREAARQGSAFHVSSQSEELRTLLSIYAAPPTEEKPPAGPPGLFERTGAMIFAAAAQALDFLVLTSDTAALALKGLLGRMVPMRTFVEQSIRIGSQSLPIIALISFLVGLTTALQAAYQLRQFGANIYIANLVGVAMLAEMGPLMTAIVMAGRCGSSIAAEISPPGAAQGHVFALIIGLVAAHVGFGARGGATGVGRSTTAAVVASTEFEGFAPFDDFTRTTLRWDNNIGLRITSFVSANYIYRLKYEPGLNDRFQHDHQVQLRFSYKFF